MTKKLSEAAELLIPEKTSRKKVEFSKKKQTQPNKETCRRKHTKKTQRRYAMQSTRTFVALTRSSQTPLTVNKLTSEAEAEAEAEADTQIPRCRAFGRWNEGENEWTCRERGEGGRRPRDGDPNVPLFSSLPPGPGESP